MAREGLGSPEPTQHRPSELVQEDVLGCHVEVCVSEAVDVPERRGKRRSYPGDLLDTEITPLRQGPPAHPGEDDLIGLPVVVVDSGFVSRRWASDQMDHAGVGERLQDGALPGEPAALRVRHRDLANNPRVRISIDNHDT
jgi:hypothetical protein